MARRSRACHFRVVNDLDVIPRLPPVIPNPVLPYFEHSGQLHHLVNGGLRVLLTGEDPFAAVAGLPTAIELKRMLANNSGVLGELPPFLSDHAPVNYVAKLERFAD